MSIRDKINEALDKTGVSAEEKAKLMAELERELKLPMAYLVRAEDMHVILASSTIIDQHHKSIGHAIRKVFRNSVPINSDQLDLVIEAIRITDDDAPPDNTDQLAKENLN